MRSTTIVAIAWTWTVSMSGALACDIFVDVHADPEGQGTQEAPYDTLEAGLGAADNEDEICVAEGNYLPAGDEFELPSLEITVQGGYPEGFPHLEPDPEAYPTILTADTGGDDIDDYGYAHRTDNRYVRVPLEDCAPRRIASPPRDSGVRGALSLRTAAPGPQ